MNAYGAIFIYSCKSLHSSATTISQFYVPQVDPPPHGLCQNTTVTSQYRSASRERDLVMPVAFSSKPFKKNIYIYIYLASIVVSRSRRHLKTNSKQRCIYRTVAAAKQLKYIPSSHQANINLHTLVSMMS